MCGNAGNQFLKLRGAFFKRLLELFLLTGELLQNLPGIGFQFGIKLLVAANHDFRQLCRKQSVYAKLTRLADHSADQTAQDISLIDFAGGNAVRHDKCRRTRMFHDDTLGAASFFAFLMHHAAKLVQLRKQRSEKFRLVTALFPLKDRRHTFNAHTGIHILLRQRLKFSIGSFVILHEHIIPDFNPQLVPGIKSLGSGKRTGPVEHLRIGTAGTGLSGGTPPVVFFRTLCNPFLRNAERTPLIERLLIERRIFIARKHCHSQHFHRYAEIFFGGQELKTEFNRLLFEVIAKRPVAQHFKECEMHRIADFVDITGPDAFLHVGKACSLRMLSAEQVRNQRMHSGSGEKNGGIVVGNEGSTLDDGVTFALEKAQVFFS